MSDPLDAGVIAPPPIVAPDPPAEPVVDQAELLRQQNEKLQAMLEQQGAALNDMRAHLASSTAPSLDHNPQDPNAEFWANPSGNARELARQEIAATVAPQANAINEKLGRIAISSYLATKSSSPYYAACVPIFKREVAKVPLAALGAATDDQIQAMLDVAWRAAIGEYSEDYQRKNPPPPPNIGGGGSGGGSGPGGKKTLAEIDPQAYNMAMRNGFSAEQMQKIADEIAEENS